MIPLFMILLLLTTIVSTFLYYSTRQEIHLVLAFFTAIIFLIWALVITHWSIHILALLILLYIPNSSVLSAKTINIYDK